MNELMIILRGGSYLYFKTAYRQADKAFDDFLEACEIARINVDNLDFFEAVLRNEDGKDIDSIKL